MHSDTELHFLCLET